jgi:hypothetical protein
VRGVYPPAEGRSRRRRDPAVRRGRVPTDRVVLPSVMVLHHNTRDIHPRLSAGKWPVHRPRLRERPSPLLPPCNNRRYSGIIPGWGDDGGVRHGRTYRGKQRGRVEFPGRQSFWVHPALRYAATKRCA